MKYFFRQFSKYVDLACKPTEPSLRTEIEQEIIFLKNKVIFGLQLILLVVLNFSFFYSSKSSDQAIILLFTLANIVVFLLTCRSHRAIFKITFVIMCVASGPLLVFFNAENVLTVFMLLFIIPELVFFITESKILSFFTVMMQFYFTKRIFSKDFVYCLSLMLENELAEKFIIVAGVGLSITTIKIGATDMIGTAELIKLIEAKRDCSETMRQKKFLMGFSHEMRNLINSLLGNLQILLMEHSNSKIHDYLKNARFCSEMLLHLINNVLDSGKIEVSELEIGLSNVKIHDSILNFWKISSELIKSKGLNGLIRVSNNVPSCLKLDSHRLGQCLMNLVQNAVKYTEKNSVNIIVEYLDICDNVRERCFQPYPFDEDGVFEKNFNLSQNSEDFSYCGLNDNEFKNRKIRQYQAGIKGVLKISVCDTGIGLSPEKLKSLLLSTPKLTTLCKKTGLGLYITKSILSKIKGKIHGYSVEGKGSVFTICIPTETCQSTGQVVPQSDQGKNLTALIVDDEQFSLNILAKYLGKWKVEILGRANDGFEAVQKYINFARNNKAPKIVTMDISMQNCDGKEAAKKIRDYERENNLEKCFLVMISGNCSQTEIEECLDTRGLINADVFLKKPVKFEDLEKIIAEKFY